MNLLTKAKLLKYLLVFRFTWKKRNTHYQYTVPGNPKFMGPRDAIKKFLRDDHTLAIAGLGAHMRACIMYWAIKELYEETGHPCNLDLFTVAGQGGRGRLPGTVEELAVPGLCRCLTAGHQELYKAFRQLAQKGQIELQCLPQGVLSLLVDAQMRGEDSLALKTGIGTFVDPRVGRGSPLTDGPLEQLVEVDGDLLRYRAPKADVAIFNAPAADREGNIYMKNAAIIGDSYELVKATKLNGGKVIANVGLVVEKGYDDIFLPAEDIDAVVVYPGTEQTGGVPHRRHWSMFTTNSTVPLQEAAERARYLNKLFGITSKRYPGDDALARLAATIMTQNMKKGDYVNIGVGMPEEACYLLAQANLTNEIKLVTETGVEGGLPMAGVYFGASACPTRIRRMGEMFWLCYEKLHMTVLGLLQADSEGNVNVSKRGEGPINYVGPGGFIDLVTAARVIIFAGSWMAHAEIKADNGTVQIEKPGTPKFVDKVDEITFCGPEALKAGKTVYYVTHVGAFQLTERGMELIAVMPGIDIEKDIMQGCPMKVVLPESGEIPLVERSIVTGQAFSLAIAP